MPLAVLFVRVGLYNHPAGLGLWIAHTLLAVPFAFFVLRDGFRRIPASSRRRRSSTGRPRFAALVHVTLPLARSSLAAAALLVFLVSWDEFAYALLLQVTNRPLPPLLYYLCRFRLSRHGERRRGDHAGAGGADHRRARAGDSLRVLAGSGR